jgi:hypothetical protein
MANLSMGLAILKNEKTGEPPLLGCGSPALLQSYAQGLAC